METKTFPEDENGCVAYDFDTTVEISTIYIFEDGDFRDMKHVRTYPNREKDYQKSSKGLFHVSAYCELTSAPRLVFHVRSDNFPSETFVGESAMIGTRKSVSNYIYFLAIMRKIV